VFIMNFLRFKVEVSTWDNFIEKVINVENVENSSDNYSKFKTLEKKITLLVDKILSTLFSSYAERSILLRDRKKTNIIQYLFRDQTAQHTNPILQQIFFYLEISEKRLMQLVNKNIKQVATKLITKEEEKAENLVKFFAKHYPHFTNTPHHDYIWGTFHLDKNSDLIGVAAASRFYYSWNKATKKLKRERDDPQKTFFINFKLRLTWDPRKLESPFVLIELPNPSVSNPFVSDSQNRVRNLFIKQINQKALISWNKNLATLEQQKYYPLRPKWLEHYVDYSIDENNFYEK
jgi:hypothetical protein